MFSHDLQHTSNTTSKAPAHAHILWTNTTGDASESYSSPIVGYGKVVVGSGSSYIYCFEEDTGEFIWKKYFNKVNWGTCGSGTLVNGNLYMGAEDNKMYCFNPDNGDVKWSHPADQAVWSSPAVYNNKVYFGSADRWVYCVDETSGNLLWKYETNHSTYGYQDYGVSSSPAIANGRLYIAACDGNLTCLPLTDPDSSGVITWSEKYWEFNTGCYVYASPTVYNGKVYIGTGSYSKMAGAPLVYKMYCLDESTGTQLWEFTAGSYIMATPAIAYGKMYFGSMDGRMYCLPLEDPNDNGVISPTEIYWEYNTGGNEIWGSAVIADERVYFTSGIPYWENGNDDYRVYCAPLDDPNGNRVMSTDELVWSYQIDAGILSSPAIVNGKMFIFDYDGVLYCFTDDYVLPRVEAINPKADAVDVTLDTTIDVTFNEAVDPATVSSTSFMVKDDSSVSVDGVVSYDEGSHKATFAPGTDLEELTTYTVTLTGDITDINGNNLDCNGNGIADPGEEYSWSFSTAIYPPEISAIPIQRPVEGEDLYLNLTTYVSDPNTLFENLIITENSTYTVISGDNIIFNYPDGIATDVVNLTVSDGISTVWHDIMVEVKPTNNAPEISKIPDVYATEDIDKIVDISSYVTDVDNELSELVVTEDSLYVKVNGMELTFNYPDGILSEIVNVSVTDGYKLDYQHVNVYVSPVNDAPYLDELDDREVAENSELVIDLTKYIEDIDNELDELEVTTNSSYAEVDKIGTGDECVFKVTFKYPDGVPSEMVKISVSDGDKSCSRTINITINPVNDAPVIDDIPVQYAIEDVNYILDLTKYVTDVDTPMEDLNPYLNSVYLVGTEGLVLTFNYPNGVTEDTVNISIKDGKLRCYVDVEFVIIPVNDPPTLYNGEVQPGSGDTGTRFTFTVLYWDVDGDDEPTVELVVGGEVYEMEEDENADVGVNRLKFTITVKIQEGKHDYYFRCDDNSGESNSSFQTETSVVEVDSDNAGLGGDVGLLILVAVVIVIVIIVVVILLFLFVWKKKFKKQEPEEIQTYYQQNDDEAF
jgi:outer membrane protein assembly factor BamB